MEITHKWKYWNKFNPEDYLGFIYKIVNCQTGQYYIGKKVFWNNKKHKLTRKQLAELQGPGRKPTHEVIRTESNWQEYWGSNKQLLEDIKTLGEEHFECTILKLCKTKKQMTYYEMHYQCTGNCIIPGNKSYNDNILGKFFTKDLLESE